MVESVMAELLSADTVKVVNRQHSWVSPGRPAAVAGYHIPDGMFYLGRCLRSVTDGTEPALINPELPVTPHHATAVGHDLAPRPSYHLISPADRAAYLAWLADGRRDTKAPVGFVWLFFFGLERRLLLDMAHDPAVTGELPIIAGEVRRLLACYGAGTPYFNARAADFLDVIELLSAPRAAPAPHQPAPIWGGERLPVPMALRLALARYAAAGMPVPVDWARSWAWYHPALVPRPPQTRCAQEFDRLFALRYAQRFGAGLVPRPTGAPLAMWYQPGNPGLVGLGLDRADLPDVLKEPTATRELGVLIDSVTGALDPYSRWLAKAPAGRGTLAATALLPAELLDHDAGPLGHLSAWAEAKLDGNPSAVIEVADFTAFWSTAHPERMAKDEAAALAWVLSRIGLGIEPDVRFKGPALTPGPAVLFRLGSDDPDSPRSDYLTAVTMLHLAAGVVSAIDADDIDNCFDMTVDELAATVRLTAGECSRLRARLRWLLAAGCATTGLGRRIAVLGQPAREAAGHFLIAVAAGARTIPPAVVATLGRAYRLLGLDADLVIRRLHQRSVGDGAAVRGGRPRTEDPVVVRCAGPSEFGHALPWSQPTTSVTPGVQLSQEMISRKITETKAAGTLLATIFVDDEPIQPVPDATTYLDRAHSALLRELATRTPWTRAEFAELAGRHGVLPDGALDLLNEAAFDTVGELVCEGEGDLTVNNDVLRELLE